MSVTRVGVTVAEHVLGKEETFRTILIPGCPGWSLPARTELWESGRGLIARLKKKTPCVENFLEKISKHLYYIFIHYTYFTTFVLHICYTYKANKTWTRENRLK